MADTLILDNSIWPNGMITNSDNYDVFSPLGTIKVAVPTSSSEWPKGDKLISPFVYKDDKLVGFIDTKALTVSNNTMIYLPYEHIEAEFSSINKGQLQIHAPKATVKKASWADSGKEDIPEVQFKYKGCKTVDDMTAVDADFKTNDVIDGIWSEPLWDLENGYEMFKFYINLTTFSSDLPSLTNGNSMFKSSSGLTSFSSDLSSLTNSDSMFQNCYQLISFSSELSSLTNGSWMFYNCDGLTTFNSDLSSLTDGNNMFDACDNLTSFNSNLPNLTNGTTMFYGCKKLTSFNSDLPSLTDSRSMFKRCKLDAQSVANIVHTLPTHQTGGSILIGIGCDATEADQLLFAQECDCENWQELLEDFSAKNWTVEIECNGRPTTTYNMISGETLPIYAKLEEVIMPTDENERKPHYDYTSQDGTKFYNINYFHSTNGSTEGYDVFSSLEEAIETLNIIPIERQ